MSILINKDTRLIVQGITGRDGSFHATKMKEYGTNVVGGTSPGKAGEEVAGIPVFNTVRDAVEATNANTSVIFVPAAFAKDAMLEAADAGIKLIYVLLKVYLHSMLLKHIAISRLKVHSLLDLTALD